MDGRRAPSWTDVLVALFVTGVMIGASVAEAHPTSNATAAQVRSLHAHQPGGFYALVVIAGASLLFRRRWPLPVLTVAVATTAIYSALGFVPGGALCGVYVALFTVGTLESRRVVITATVGAVAVLFVTAGAGSIFGWLGGTNSVMVACCVAASAVGLAVAGRRQVFATMVERAERAERDREDEARRRVDAERLRIARELHDVVAHSMSMINVQAGMAAHVLSTHPQEAAEALSAIKEASREGLQELRAILNVLRQVDADGEERGPAPRLSQLRALADATTQAGLPTSLSVTGDPTRVPAAVELAVYRLVQESLTNVLRHAGPDARAAIVVEVREATVEVAVTDDGRGGPPVAFPDGTGSGLAGMKERAAAFGGTLEAGPGGEGGWQVTAVLPLGTRAVAVADTGRATRS